MTREAKGMAMKEGTFQLLGVYPASKGKNYLAKVDFMFAPPPILEVRGFYRTDEGDRRRPVNAEIHGATMIRVRAAYLRLDNHGEPLVSGDIEPPYEVMRAVAAEAYRRVEEREASAV